MMHTPQITSKSRLPRTSHLDAAQGNTEVRSELYAEVLRASTEGNDAALRQERGRRDRPGLTAGPRGGGSR